MKLRCLVIGAWLLSLAGDAAAQTLSAEQKTFVDSYVDAIRAKDVAKLKTLVHPGSLACITPDSAEFFHDIWRGA